MPDTSHALSLPLIQPSQAQKHVTHNEALRILDAVVQLVVIAAVPDFLDQLALLFPVLLAVERDNSAIANLHIADERYRVMNLHVTKFRFPNIVAGYDPQIEAQMNMVTNSQHALRAPH